MKFDPKLLPPTVYDAYKKGPIAWILVIQIALDVGIRDIDWLTDIAFHLHNPILGGRPLRSDETKLVAQWKAFHNLIKPLVSARSGTTVSIIPPSAVVKLTHTNIDPGVSTEREIESIKLNFTKIYYFDTPVSNLKKN